MPFYLRKSVSAGPFRFNFSNGGVGVSVGVKGLRLGTGPRGHFIHAGSNGIYYRASLGRAGERRAARPPDDAGPQPQPGLQRSDVDMVEVDSGSVGEMRDEAFASVIDEMNARHRQPRMAKILAWGMVAAGCLVSFVFGPGGLLICLLGLPAWAIGRWLDSYRRTTVLFYQLDPQVEQAYRALRAHPERS